MIGSCECSSCFPLSFQKKIILQNVSGSLRVKPSCSHVGKEGWTRDSQKDSVVLWVYSPQIAKPILSMLWVSVSYIF